jgi:hypothetical protein
MRARFLTAVAAIALPAACTLPTHIDLPGLPSVDLGALPRLPSTDHLTLIEIAGSRLDLDPSQNDALTALGSCADLVSYCASPTRALDACVDGARACATDTPWREHEPCCPSACRDAYHRARAGGATPAAAFRAVWFDQPDCFPGARAALEGQ